MKKIIRSFALFALVLEGADRRQQRRAEIGGGIAEIVAARRVEEKPERRVVGGERELEKRAPSEHHEPDTVFRRRRDRLPGQTLARGEPGAAGVGCVHGAREVQEEQHVTAGSRQLAPPLAELRPRQGQHGERERREPEPESKAGSLRQ